MKISVTASRRDDILREQAEYNDLRKKQNAVHYQQEARFEETVDWNYALIEDKLRSMVPGLNDLGVRISMNGYRYSDGSARLSIDFDASSRGNDSSSLLWSWRVELDREGNISKDSSSWSGIKVTTPEQIEDLKKSVDVLSSLVNMDWAAVLDEGRAGLPRYSDYVSVRELKSRDYEFNEKLTAAAVEDIIGADKWILGSPINPSRWDYGDKWYMIHSQTDKFYTISVISDRTIKWQKEEVKDPDKLREQIAYNATVKERVKKDKFIDCISTPIQLMDMEGNITSETSSSESAEADTKVSSNLITI